jgi:hypothetical protein
MGRQADKLGLSQDTQRNISNLSNALGGAMGAGFIPSYLPKVPGGLATLGERAYEIINPSKQMTAAQIEAMRVANQGARVAEAAKTAEMAGALPGEALTAAQAVEAANAAKLAALPSKAERVQDAAALRQAQEANRLAATGKAAQYGGQAAAGSATVGPMAQATPDAAGGIPDLGMDPAAAFRKTERDSRKMGDEMPKEVKKEATTLGKETVPKAERKGLTNDDYLMIGLGLLAGESPDPLKNFGTAGIGALKARQERFKDEREAESDLIKNKYYGALARQADAMAGSYESGDRMMPQALKAGNDAYDDWFKSLSPIQQMELKPGQAEAKRQELLQAAMLQFRMKAGTGVAIPEGVKVNRVG